MDERREIYHPGELLPFPRAIDLVPLRGQYRLDGAIEVAFPEPTIESSPREDRYTLRIDFPEGTIFPEFASN